MYHTLKMSLRINLGLYHLIEVIMQNSEKIREIEKDEITGEIENKNVKINKYLIYCTSQKVPFQYQFVHYRMP